MNTRYLDQLHLFWFAWQSDGKSGHEIVPGRDYPPIILKKGIGSSDPVIFHDNILLFRGDEADARRSQCKILAEEQELVAKKLIWDD